MREILFRGQMRKKGEKVRLDGSPVDGIWVFGGVSQFNGGERAIIYQTEPCIEKFPVYGDTVGQYTGLTDKNGKKIFEGDIVRYGTDIYEVVFETRCGCGYFGIKMYHIETWNFCNITPANLMEIIGNIHDNPELLKGVNE